METYDREYVWSSAPRVKRCVFIPHIRTIICETIPNHCRIVMHLSDVKQRVCYASDMPESLAKWWSVVCTTSTLLPLSCANNGVCDEMLQKCGPITVNKIYRYNIAGIYISAREDALDQRRLLTLVCTQRLPRDVTMMICARAYLMMIDESVLRVVELQ